MCYNIHMEKLHLSWHALEFEHKQKTPDWFWAVSLISVCIIATTIFYQNYLFAVFIFLSTTILLYKANQTPHIISCEITNRGITLDNYLFPYNSIEAFWIEPDSSNSKHHKILLRVEKTFSPLIVIPAGHQDVDELHRVLSLKVKEEKMEEPPLLKLMNHLGF